MSRSHLAAPSASALVALFVAAGASAATLKVPQQFATIQGAVDAADPGDVIQVAKGIYSENVSISAKNGLTLVGKPGAIIDAGSADDGVSITGSQSIAIRGLTVRNSGTSAGFLLIGGTDVEIRQCTIEGVFGHGILVDSTSNVRLLDNQVTAAGEDGILVDTNTALVQGNTIRGSAGPNVRVLGSFNTVQDNTLQASASDSITVGNGGGTSTGFNLIAGNRVLEPSPIDPEDGILLLTSPNTWIVDNTVTAMSAEGIEVVGSEETVVQGNTVKKCLQNGIEIRSPNVALLDNAVKADGQNGVFLDTLATDTYAFANVVKKSASAGFLVGADDCVLVQNSATGSTGLDLSVTGMNLVLIDNNFPKVL
jgi:parallel beta-helix repeat protein